MVYSLNNRYPNSTPDTDQIALYKKGNKLRLINKLCSAALLERKREVSETCSINLSRRRRLVTFTRKSVKTVRASP